VQPGDSLVAIRKKVIADKPELNLCTGLIQRANQLRDGNSIHPGQKLRIPLDAVHTLVSLRARFLLYYHGEEVVAAWPVTIGREDRTVPGEYTVGEKQEEPMWFRQGDPVPFGEPENPLGTRWIAWAGSNGLGFHGTWEPEKIGQAASDGCIRMKNEDVELLFEVLPRASRIVVLP
jgi:lipoprotein-anchoring transpeptidase ErfK/SrfK